MDDPALNVPADIYRNIRNKALEDAAKVADDYAQFQVAEALAIAIRALKVPE